MLPIPYRSLQSLALNIVAGAEEHDGSRVGGPETEAAARTAVTSSSAVQQSSPSAMPASNSVTSLSPMVDMHAVARAVATCAPSVSSMRLQPAEPESSDLDSLPVGQLVEDDDVGGGDDALAGASGDARHTLVIGAWVVTREASLLLGQIIDACPLAPCAGRMDPPVSGDVDASLPSMGFLGPTNPGGAVAEDASGYDALCRIPVGLDDPRDAWLISSGDVSVTGAGLLCALLRLKHLGCIYNAAEGLRSICSRLLRHKQAANGFAKPHEPQPLRLNELPRAWLESLLGHVREATQFILRRSAGFAQAFLAIAASEPRDDHGDSPNLLKHAATSLLHCAGIRADAVSSASGGAVLTFALSPSSLASGRGSDASGDWRTRVHAMNILRLLFKDSQVVVRFLGVQYS